MPTLTCFAAPSAGTSRIRNFLRTTLIVLSALGMASQAQAATATSTTLTIAASTVSYKTPIVLTATVTAGGSPVTTGLVLFCDATAPFCENNSNLGYVQLTAANGTAVLKVGSGALGPHTYKAVYRTNSTYATSVSNTVTYTVAGTYPSTATIVPSGSVGNYTLNSTVVGVGQLTFGPTGSVSFLDTSAGNNLLGTRPLGAATLSNVFVAAPNSPFAVGIPGNNRGNRSVAIASAYLDGDNNLDVVTGDAQQTISVMLGNGDGSFKPKVNYPGCPVGKALKILLADFNRDGNTDIALGCSDGTNGGLVILLGNGDGTFRAPTQYTSGDVFGMAIGDFNGDGLLDVAVTDRTQSNVTIFLGKGDGTFQAGTVALTLANLPHDIVVADFNQDGKDDVAYAVDSKVGVNVLSNLYVAAGKGDGTFQAPTLAATQIGEFLTVGDTNADNKADVVSCTITLPALIGNNMFVLMGNGDGTFKPTVAYISDDPSDPNLADVNGDGETDIVAGGTTGAVVHQGNGDGTFQPYIEPAIGGFGLTYAVNVGDYNNDGNADLIGTDANTPRAGVVLSEVQQTANATALIGVAMFPLGSGTHYVDASYLGDSTYQGSVSTTVPLAAAPTPTTLNLAALPSGGTLVGQTLTLTATLSPYKVGPPATTTDGETVSFYNGATLLKTATLTNGVATITTSTLPLGTDALKAVFGGDANYNTSTSNTLNVTVGNIVIASSLNPSTYGQSVTLTANVIAGATGTVTFKDGSAVLSVVTIAASTAAYTTSTFALGAHDITAVYSGDGTHSAATSPHLSQQVNQVVPTVTVTTSGPSTFGGSVTITATLPVGPTGTVTFTSGGVTLGTGTLSAGGTVTIATSALPAGSDVITASYGGDTNDTAASGSTTQTVAKFTPAVTVATSGASTYGGSVSITATLPVGPTGTVTFTSGGVTLGSGAVSAGGTVTVATTVLPAGSDVITASYGGDANNNAATGSTTQTVAKLTPAVTVTTSGPSTFGGSVTITAALPVGPTGTVTFTSGGVTLGSGTVSAGGTVAIATTALPVGSDVITASYGGDANDNAATGTTTQTVAKATPVVTVTTSGPSTYGSSVSITAALPVATTGSVTFTSGGVTLGTGTVSAAGTVVIASSSLPAGSDVITANYGGDANNNAASGSTTQTVAKATPVVTVTTSGPSTYGSSVTITASVPAGTTGTVTFVSGGVTLGTGTVNAAGAVAISTSALPVGSDVITASYGGDANNNSAKGSVTQTVAKATPVLPAPVASPSTVTVGSSVTLSETVPSGTPGPVSFYNGGTLLGTAPLVGGVATISVTTLPIGTDSITATTPADVNNNPATSPATAVTVTKITPVVTVTTSGPSTYGGSVTITASVPAGTTGTITLSSGGVTLGTGTVSAAGMVLIATNSLPAGSDVITANYSGDVNNNAATGSTTQTVAKATPVLPAPGVSSANLKAGSPETITEAVPAGVSGPVTFYSGATVLGTAPIVGGVATLTVTSLPVGTDAITATTPGDANYNPATSPATAVVVIKATPVLPAPGVSATNLTAGSPETITEAVPAGVSGPVTFYNGATVLGTAPIVGGVATLTVTNLPVGTAAITASTPGDANNNPATSPATAVVVTKATPVVTVATTGPSTYGGSVTITATLPVGPTGTVTFTSGGVTLGSGAVSAAGTVSVSTTVLPVGSDVITASYGGDASNNPATGSTTQTVGKATPALPAPVASPSNPTVGSTVTLSETVPAGVSGPVSFYNGGTLLGTAPVIGGVATLPVTTLPLGANSITATTPGDANDTPATSPATIVTVVKTTPVVTVTTSGPSTFGGSVTITSSVPAGATGTITVTSSGVTLGSGTVNAAGTVTVTTSALPAGSDVITASYSGDANNNPATGSATQAVGKTTPVVTVTTSGPSTFGGNVTITSSVPAGTTGTIVVTSGGVTLGSGTVNAAGVVSVTTSSLPSGSDVITASYGGDTNNNSATGTTTQAVGKATPTVTVTTSGPSAFGGSVTITAALPAGTTGTVTFTSGGVTLGTGSVSGVGAVTVTTAALPVGSDVITASYGGDSNDNPATGSTTQSVSKATPAVGLSSSSNPSTAGQTVTFTATLPTNVTGSVTFMDGATVLGTGTVTNGIAAFTVSSLTVGSHTISANYGGDANDNPNSSAPLTQVATNKTTPALPPPGVSSTTLSPGSPDTITETVPAGVSGPVTFYNGSTVLGTAPVVGGVATLTVPSLPIGSDPITATTPGDTTNNPATSPATVVTVTKTTPVLPAPGVSSTTLSPGSPETITETVPAGVSGPVTFSNGSTVLGTAPVVGGVATLTVSSLPAGVDPITASTPGDANNNPATSPATAVTVTKTTPGVTVTTSGPSTYGGSVTITVSVPAGATGSVTVTSGGVTLGSGTVSAGGTVTVTTTALPVGSDVVTASYGGDTNNNPATGSTTQSVAKVGTTVTLTSSANPSTPGQTVTFTAALPVSATGTVTFLDGGATLGTGAITNGVATLTVSNLTSGSHTIVASYGGDTNNSSESSAPLTQVVSSKTTPVLPAPGVSSTNLNSGSPETITETVPAGVSGPVTFYDGSTVLGTAPVVGGVATLTVPSLPVGVNSITATTPGDTNNNPATSPATAVTVTKTTPVVTVTTFGSGVYGSTVTIVAALPAGATGTVTFTSGGVTLGTGTVNAAGTVTATTILLPVGTDTITASYGGDANDNPATGSATQIVSKGTPVLPAPVASPNNPTLGSTVTLTETVPAGDAGPVTFYNGATVLGTAPVVGGVATLTVTNLPLGTNSITAGTPGDANNNAAVSPATVVVVTKPVGTVTLTSSINPAALNQAVVFTAMLNSGATGTVTFLDGATILGTGSVNAGGMAVLSTSSLTAGSHAITAAYGGDSTFGAMTSAVLTEVISKAASTIVLTESSPAELLGTVVTFTANVTTASPTPTGTVTFFDGGTALGTTPLSTNGVVVTFATSGNAAFVASALATGSHQFTAVYSGDSTFAGSNSAPLTNVVEDFSNVNKGAATQTVLSGDKTSYTFTLTPIGASNFLNNVTLAVTGLPTGATYTVTPATIAAGGGAVDVVLDVQTVSQTTTAGSRAPRGVPGPQRGVPIALGMLGLVGLGAIRRRRRELPRMLMLALLAVASLLPIAAMTGCAGGYFGLKPTNYSITVTGTEGTIQHSATATLVVQ